MEHIDNNIDNSIEKHNESDKISNVDYKINTLINFINNRKKELSEIYIQNFDRFGDGVLMLRINSASNNVDVCYAKLEFLVDSFRDKIIERKKENNSNIIYFYLDLGNDEDSKIIEIDVRDYVQHKKL